MGLGERLGEAGVEHGRPKSSRPRAPSRPPRPGRECGSIPRRGAEQFGQGGGLGGAVAELLTAFAMISSWVVGSWPFKWPAVSPRTFNAALVSSVPSVMA